MSAWCSWHPIQRRKLPVHGGLGQRQTPGTGGFKPPASRRQRHARYALDCRRAIPEGSSRTRADGHYNTDPSRHLRTYQVSSWLSQTLLKNLGRCLAHVPGAALGLSAGCPREVPTPQRFLRRAASVTPGGRPRGAVYTREKAKPMPACRIFSAGCFIKRLQRPGGMARRYAPATGGDRRHAVVVGRGWWIRPAGRCHPGCRGNQRRTPSGWFTVAT